MRTPRLMLIAVVILISSAAEAAAPAAPADTGKSPGSSAAADSPALLQEITVLGRLKLEAKITNFVYGIALLENEEGVARWRAPVCPEVTGLTRPQGEFLLERLSGIARAAGAPLAGESCRPNLFVFVTTRPKALLQAMEKRYFAVAFGNATPTEVDAFINTPQPVRVWHSSFWTPTGGAAPMSPGVPPSAQILGNGLSEPPIYNSPGAIGVSRLMSTGAWTFGNVYVIVDAAQLRGISLRQFADYVAMVSLAEIKPNAHLGDAHSILALFGGGAPAAPTGMSDWDQAYLKSLYNVPGESTMPRSRISRGMMRELVP